MGILDVFKKNDNENEVGEKQKKNDNVEEGTTYEITLEHGQKLLGHIFNDKDHGDTMMKFVNLNENIFIIRYIETIIMPEAKKQNKTNDYMFFQEKLLSFKRILFDKIMKQEKLWMIKSNTTGFPFLENGCAHILVSDSNNEHIIEQLKKYYYEVSIIELNNEEFKNELKEFYRLGYKGILFSDGKLKPCGFALNYFIPNKEIRIEKSIMNPETQYSIAEFFQEMRRNISYEGADKIRMNLENRMISSIINAKFIVPTKESSDNQLTSPIYMPNEKEDARPGLYIFTDEVEMKSLEKIGVNFNEGWEAKTYSFLQLMKLVEGQNMSEICINYSSIGIRFNEAQLKVIKEGAEKIAKRKEEERIKDHWDSVELPRLLKDKEVPSIKDSDNKVLFSRENNSVSISTFIFNILKSKNKLDEILEFFFDDENIEEIKFYDINDRTIVFKLKENENKSGLFITPMRYEDDDENEEINDTVMHYTQNAANIKLEDENGEKIEGSDKIMNLYSIFNKEDSKKYIPLFTDKEEIKSIYPENKYRYCTLSYEDIIKQIADCEGIVINPMSMSIVMSNKFLNNVVDVR